MENLRKLTETILSEKSDFSALEQAIKGMQAFYEAHTHTDMDNLPEDGINLPSGLAISPWQAAACLKEVRRTTIFLRGIHKAILQLKQDFPGEKINVLYAGCGPYATLLTPFTTLFNPNELAFYMLDINEESLNSVRLLYSELGITEHIAEIICGDAATIVLPQDHTIHMAVSETMQKALIQEPQVSIMLNIIPQMEDNAIFIPEEINVSMKLLTMAEHQMSNFIGDRNPEHIDLGHLYTIGRQDCKPPAERVITIPQKIDDFITLNLFTDITVYKDEKLYAHNCTLNLPLMIANVENKTDKKVVLRYDMGPLPEFRCEWLG